MSTKQNIIRQCCEMGFNKFQIAYVLATVEHETNGTFLPVKEAYWLSEDWREANLRYYPYYGRGYVQITWKENYRKFSDVLGVDLVKDPNLALDPEIAAIILIYGFKHGTFTGKKISDYITKDKQYYRKARKCINGLDCADKIANLAHKYVSELSTPEYEIKINPGDYLIDWPIDIAECYHK